MVTRNKIYSMLYILLFFVTKAYSEVTIGFIGDVMLGRMVGEMLVAKKDFAYPWGNLLPILTHTDFNIANLETTFSKDGVKAAKAFNFQSDPSNVEALVQANIRVVNLANNHILDYGIKGLKETIRTLNAVNIKHTGAGLTLNQAQYPAYITKKDINFAILGFTDNEPSWAARENKAGVNYITTQETSIATIRPLIQMVKKNADIVIVSLHGGPNWDERPSRKFQKFAHKLLDAGVDIIHGHSPHIFQGVEIYKNKLIMYSTGDFIDDYATDEIMRNDQSFFFLVTVDKKGLKELRLIPVTNKNMQVNKAPLGDRLAILQRMQRLSSDLNTKIPINGIWQRFEE
jgi:poly-gamma-glutamate capsule biosynthesis protein CapA/YwtB (metallophosphatase superfamily)